MSFDPNKPADDDYVIDLCADIRSNFQAIYQGSGNFSQQAVVLANRSSLSLPTPTDTSGITLFCKNDSDGEPQLYLATPQGTTQITTLPAKVLGSSGTRFPGVHISQPGGLLMEFGYMYGYNTHSWIKCNSFSQLYNIQITWATFDGEKSLGMPPTVLLEDKPNVPPQFRVLAYGASSQLRENLRFFYTLLGVPR